MSRGNDNNTLKTILRVSCLALILLFVILVLTIALLLNVPSQTMQQQEWARNSIDTIRWLLTSLPPLVSWPIVVLFAVLYLGRSQSAADHLSRLFGRFRSIKVLGTEVNFSEEGARQLSLNAEEAFTEFRRQADHEFQRQVSTNNLRGKLEQLFVTKTSCSDDAKIRDCVTKDKFRCTIHVPDILFDDTLYQLLDYYPKQTIGGKAGRRFSMRYGIIGRAWRMHAHDGEDRAKRSPAELVEIWGMHEEEAQTKSRQRPAYICAILRDDQLSPLGILYMDSTEDAAFGNHQGPIELAKAIAEKSEYLGLNEALTNVVRELRKYGAGIRIHD